MFGMAVFGFTSCGDVEDEITSLVFDRNFSPVGLEASAISESSAKLDWTASSGATSYTIEVYADDSLTFAGSPAKTITGVTDDQIPYTITGLVYDTQYSVRVQALDENNPDRNSKWSQVYFQTSAQQIFNSMKTEDVADKSVYLSWKNTDTNVTRIDILDANGKVVVSYTLTDEDKANGYTTISGLSPETTYTAKLYYGNKQRGSRTFTTIADLNGAITVRSSEDLRSIIESADEGAVIALYGGTYNIQTENTETGALENTSARITKTLTIKGIYPTDLPTIKGRFQLENGAGLTLSQVILDGSENNSTDQCFNYKTADVTYAPLTVTNCEIKGYAKGVYYANVASTIESITFDQCDIHDITCDGGDMFDSRKAYIKTLTFSNSSIWNSAQERDFIRYDDNSSTLGGSPVITVDHCTINNVCNTASNKRLLYVRYANNAITWSNNLVTNTKAVFSNQSKTNAPTFTNNAYYNCPDNMFQIVEKTTTVADENGQQVGDPAYADAAHGDFTIGNEAVSKLGVGATKWY